MSRRYITPSEYDRAAANGIGRRTLESRIHRDGWGIRRATTEPPTTNEYLKIAKANGISAGTYRQRVKVYHWSPEVAATKPVATVADRLKIMAAARKARHPPKRKTQ